MKVIAISSQAQHGKDSVGDRLVKILGDPWQAASFASNVKKIYCETLGVNLDFVEKWKVKPEAPPGFDMNVRQGLQFIGDGFRKIRSTIWLDLAFRDKDKAVVIRDGRYRNEFLRAKKEGGLNIIVGRTDKINDDPNGSEAQIKPYVLWCLETFSTNKKHDKFPKTYVRKIKDVDLSEAPADMAAIDLFIRNDGTLEELYETIDSVVVPYVRNFKFK